MDELVPPQVSVVISTLNREASLVRTLQYFLFEDDFPNKEILVVDQTAQHTEATQRFLDAHRDRVRVLRPAFRSLVKARNLGWRTARGEVVLFCDDDVQPAARYVAAHWETHRAFACAAVTGPFVMPGTALKARTDLDVGTLAALDAKTQGRFDVDFAYSPCWAPGGNLSVKRAWLEKTGGFDEYFYGPAVGEDAEFCHRLTVRKGEIRYAPAAYLLHVPEDTGGCRDEAHLGRRLVDVLDNSHYYWRKIGMTPTDIARAFLQVFRAQVGNRDNRRSLGTAGTIGYFTYGMLLTLWRCRRVRSNWLA